MMRAHQIRHLPVLEGDKLTGVISERDLQLYEFIRGADPEQTRVEDVMTRDVYTAPPDALLSDVAHEMAAHKYGAAVVVDHGKVVGMFTSVDAMAALSTLLTS
jgi:acetoin utilization protein AcuB